VNVVAKTRGMKVGRTAVRPSSVTAGNRRNRPVDAAETDYRERLAVRLREARAERGMTRNALAEASGVSLRFLAQLESAAGNPSLMVMRQIAAALGMPLESLIAETPARPVDQALILQMLNRLAPAQLPLVRELIAGRFGPASRQKALPIVLLGLRGAGKSTLGRRLAQHLRVPFVELDREVERAYGATIGEILQLHGQPGYRRYERLCLLQALDRHEHCVIETGGGLATDPETLELVLERTHAVWVRASPEEHMARVIEQGDLRPMAKSSEAMADLKAILKAREPYYRQAPLHLNTGRKSVDASFRDLLMLLGAA
jgi:XRE family transcriptional regulator, aerobic/anaerobic benzoate catabolism transcriptional regulator